MKIQFPIQTRFEQNSQVNLLHSIFLHPLNSAHTTNPIFETLWKLLFSTIDEDRMKVKFSSLSQMLKLSKSSPK